MVAIVPAAGPLIYVAKDLGRVAVRRRGRYSMEREAAESERHRAAALHEAQAKMIEGLAKMGYAHTGDAFVFNGFEEHVDFGGAQLDADVQAPAADPAAMDQVHYLDELKAWEKAEKARAARRAGLIEELVDFTITSTFVRSGIPEGPARADGTIGRHRVHIPEAR